MEQETNQLDNQYQQLLKDIIHYGVEKTDRTGTGTKSIFGYTIRHNMRDGFPVLTTKKMAWKSIVTELLWFLRGDTNIKFLVDNGCHIWDGDAFKNFLQKSEGDPDLIWNKEQFINLIKNDEKFAKEWGELGPIYGKQWRSWSKLEPNVGQSGIDKTYLFTNYNGLHTHYLTQIDQIQNLINELKTNPDSRRLMVNAWNVGELDQMVLPPCHYGFQMYTRELSLKERCDAYMKWSNDPKCVEWKNHIENEMGWDYEKPDWIFKEVREQLDKAQFPTRAISLMWNQRSVDTFLGLPFNIASYGLLLTLLGKLTNMVPESLIGNLGDTHLYLDHIEQAKEQIERSSFDLPKINLNFDFIFRDGYSVAWDKIKVDEIQLINYKSQSQIKAPLSN